MPRGTSIQAFRSFRAKRDEAPLLLATPLDIRRIRKELSCGRGQSSSFLSFQPEQVRYDYYIADVIRAGSEQQIERDGPIEVFIVPHTHDDVGWLQSIDEYYIKQVRYILDSVIDNLLENPGLHTIYYF